MNTQVRIVTTHGTEVLLHPAMLQGFRPRGQAQAAAVAPLVRVQPGLLDAATRLGGVPTAVAVAKIERSAFGVLYGCADGHLVALVCDLGEPEVRSWLEAGHDRGHLPVILACGERHKLVAVQFDDDLSHMAATAVGAQKADPDDMMTVLQFVLTQLEHGETLARMGVDIATLRHGTVCLLTPDSAQAASATTH
ncbi:MAG: hypothetical protein U1F53_20750 [Burkholderiaceae bacterium]